MDEERLPDVRQRRRGIKNCDLITFGGISLFAIVVTIGAFLTKQEWNAVKVVILLSATGGMVGLSLLYFFKKWMTRPTFVTKHGTAVWTNDIPRLDQALMEKALDHFIVRMRQEVPEVVKEAELRTMLARTGIEWQSGRVSLITTRYELKDKAGIQHGYRLLVQWKGTIADSALYHEMLHEVNEFIRLPKLKSEAEKTEFRIEDIQHKEVDWWRLEGVLVDDF